MKHSLNYMASGLVVLFAATGIGCGQGFQSSSGGQNSAASATSNANVAVQKAADASASAQTTMTDAILILSQLQDGSGNINIELFNGSTPLPGKPILSEVIGKIRAAFDQVFAKVAFVKAQFAEARRLIADSIAKLDANDPHQAILIDELKQQLVLVDNLEAKFSEQFHLVAGKLDQASAGLDKLLARATGAIPGVGGIIVGIAVDYFVMNDVRALITELKGKLLAV